MFLDLTFAATMKVLKDDFEWRKGVVKFIQYNNLFVKDVNSRFSLKAFFSTL